MILLDVFYECSHVLVRLSSPLIDFNRDRYRSCDIEQRSGPMPLTLLLLYLCQLKGRSVYHIWLGGARCLLLLLFLLLGLLVILLF